MRYAALLCLFVAACGHRAPRQAPPTASETMASYIGREIGEVAAQYGPPASDFAIGDRRAFQWVMTFTGPSDPIVTTYRRGRAVTTGGKRRQLECLYTLIAEAQDGRWFVVDYYPPRPECES